MRVTKAKAEERVEREKFEIESLVERIQATAALNARNKRTQNAMRDRTSERLEAIRTVLGLTAGCP